MHYAWMVVGRDDVEGGAMSIHVIGPGLSVVFDNKHDSVVPARRFREFLYDPAESEVIISHASAWSTSACEPAGGVVHTQMHDLELRHVAVPFKLSQFTDP